MASRLKFAKDPTTSIHKIAAELKVDTKTVRMAMHDDLGLKSYTRMPRHLVMECMKARRLERCKKVLRYIKNHGSTVKIFSGKKSFTVDVVLNRRTDWYLAETKADVKGTFRTKHPDKVMYGLGCCGL